MVFVAEEGARATAWDQGPAALGEAVSGGIRKQSIYTFRRGDIETYERAKGDGLEQDTMERLRVLLATGDLPRVWPELLPDIPGCGCFVRVPSRKLTPRLQRASPH
jgi:hypothetical protein